MYEIIIFVYFPGTLLTVWTEFRAPRSKKFVLTTDKNRGLSHVIVQVKIILRVKSHQDYYGMRKI